MKKLLFILLLTVPFIGFGQGSGYKISINEELFKTTDSGNSWTSIGFFSVSSHPFFQFVSDNVVYKVRNDGQLSKSNDSGNSWISIGFYDISINPVLYFVSDNSTTNINTIPIKKSIKMIKLFNILGRKIKPQPNTLIIEIYDDGSTEKKIVVE